MPRLPATLVSCAVLCGAASFVAAQATDEELPTGVEQIIPRGAIPAVFEPEFVAADAADIADDAWVLGVEIGGEARAYSLNLLNRHEIVNDRIADRPVAAVW